MIVDVKDKGEFNHMIQGFEDEEQAMKFVLSYAAVLLKEKYGHKHISQMLQQYEKGDQD